MSEIRNLYNVYDPAFIIPNDIEIDENDWITATYDNSNGEEIKYLNFFCNVSKFLATNNIYYVFLEIAEVSGTGGIFITDSATEKEYFENLSEGQILRFKVTSLDDFSQAKTMLKTYLQFLPGEGGTLKFRISVIKDEISLDEFTYKKFGEGEYDIFIDGRWYLNIPSMGIRYLIDPNESNILSMSEVEDVTAEIRGRDGEIVLASKYRPKTFDIVAYTEDNLSPEEKQAEKDKLSIFLHSIKNKFKNIAILAADRMYPVKYSGQLVDTNFPMCVKFEIPLKSSEPLGKSLIKSKAFGNSTVSSNTLEPVGFQLFVHGPAQTPVISVNGYQMKYDNVILDGNYLEIDTKNSTAKMVTSEGVAANATIYYNLQFPKIVAGNNELKILSGVDNPNQVLIEWYDLKI